MKTFFVLIILLWGFISPAQTLIEKLGGAKTNYTITSNMKTLDVSEQVIIKRIFSNYDSGYGQFYFNESYTIEFICGDKLKELARREIMKKPKWNHHLNFYHRGLFVRLMSADKKLIHEFTVAQSFYQKKSNTGNLGFYVYTIDLIDFPLVLLNRVKYIDAIIIN